MHHLCSPGGVAAREGSTSEIGIAHCLTVQNCAGQVVSPRVRAFLYTWGGGRTTAEGEHIPFRADPLRLLYEDHLSLVLPLTLEHEIDERSPLYGHTYDSLTVRTPYFPEALGKIVQPALCSGLPLCFTHPCNACCYWCPIRGHLIIRDQRSEMCKRTCACPCMLVSAHCASSCAGKIMKACCI